MNPPSRPQNGSRPPVNTTQYHSHSQQDSGRNPSTSSESSTSSQVTTLSVTKRPPHLQQRAYTTQPYILPTVQSVLRPDGANDLPSRRGSPLAGPAEERVGQRPRQHAQGFFEPSLPTASSNNNAPMPHRSASQIAAQAAMHIQDPQHVRQRSITIPEPLPLQKTTLRRKPQSPPSIQTANIPPAAGHAPVQYHNGVVGGSRFAATTAANAALLKSPLPSPGFAPQARSETPVATEEPKISKEKSKMKLFSKPKVISISKDKDVDKRNPALPSPSRTLAKFMNASTTSLAESVISPAASIYSSNNASTSTLVPFEKGAGVEKEKHRHHFLSRQKNKLKDREDHHNLPLSSASSNSRPTDPNDPQPLYSFAPSSPGPSSTIAKSMSGFDLRHGGRALREKKKEEKAAALNITHPSTISLLDPNYREQGHNHSEWPGSASLGPPSTTTFGLPSATPDFISSQPSAALTGFGLERMTADDAWPYLKSRLLNIFAGEDLRTPIEDFNRLVIAHIQRCVQRRAPIIIVEDLRELLQTGFSSLDQTLKQVPDDRLVPHLVELWTFVFGTILPFMQAVFLPLDLEFKGKGSIMSPQAAAEFWGALPPDNRRASSNDTSVPSLGEELDVRRIVLITFRDAVILPRNDSLATIFSRLSLESLNTGVDRDPSHFASGGRPGTATSLDPVVASYNSQGSTLLSSSASGSGSGGIGSLGARSRATSNTSAGSFPSLGSPRSHHNVNVTSHPTTHHHTTHAPAHPNAPSLQTGTGHLPLALRDRAPSDPSQVTQTVARMLQCVSVLASVQSGDDAQRRMESLGRELKYNWLGRGRTGRNRRGFVGTRGVLGLSGGSGTGSNAPTIKAAG